MFQEMQRICEAFEEGFSTIWWFLSVKRGESFTLHKSGGLYTGKAVKTAVSFVMVECAFMSSNQKHSYVHHLMQILCQ